MVHYILIKFKTFWTLSGQSTIMSMLSLYNVQVSGQSTMSMLSLQVNFRLTFIFSFSTSFETASTISMKVPTIFWKSAISEWGKFKENITKNYHLNKCVIHKLILLWHFNKHLLMSKGILLPGCQSKFYPAKQLKLTTSLHWKWYISYQSKLVSWEEIWALGIETF